MIDFNDLISIKTNLFLDIIFCCRLGSKVLNKSDYEDYENLLTRFQLGDYKNQDELEQLLKNIQSYWTEEVLKDESST